MGKICCCRAGEGNVMVELTAGGVGGKPGTDNRWQLSSSTQCWSSSWSDTTYFWIQSQFFFQICWVLFRMLVRSSTHLLIIRQASSMFDNLQELTKVYLRSIMVCSVLLNCCQLRLDPCEKDSPSCILQLPGDSLCTETGAVCKYYLLNRQRMKSRIRFQNPLPREQGWLGLKKYLAGHETDLVAVARPGW